MALRRAESIHCVAVALISLAMMLAILAMALALIELACLATTPAGCAVAGLLMAAMADEAMNGVKNWAHSQGC